MALEETKRNFDFLEMDGNHISNYLLSNKQIDYEKMYHVAGKTPLEIRAEINSAQRTRCSETQNITTAITTLTFTSATSNTTFSTASATTAAISSVGSTQSMDYNNAYFTQCSSVPYSSPCSAPANNSPTQLTTAAFMLKAGQKQLMNKRKKPQSPTMNSKKVFRELTSASPSASTSKASSSNRFALLDMEVDRISDAYEEESPTSSSAAAQRKTYNVNIDTNDADLRSQQTNSNSNSNCLIEFYCQSQWFIWSHFGGH